MIPLLRSTFTCWYSPGLSSKLTALLISVCEPSIPVVSSCIQILPFPDLHLNPRSASRHLSKLLLVDSAWISHCQLNLKKSGIRTSLRGYREWESSLHCRGHRFNLCSRKILQAKEQLGTLEAMLCNKE